MRILLLLLLLTACSAPKVHFAELSKERFDPYEGHVRILDVFPQNKKYIVIGNIDVEAYFSNPNEQVVKALKKKAAENGANAIVLSEEGVVTHVQFGLKNIIGLYDAPKTARAVAIRVESGI